MALTKKPVSSFQLCCLKGTFDRPKWNVCASGMLVAGQVAIVMATTWMFEEASGSL